MKFYDYDDPFDVFKRMIPGHCTRQDMYDFVRRMPYDGGDVIGYAHLEWEQQWHNAGRPFYRVWPKVIPMLTKLDTSKVPSSACLLPEGTPNLYIQFPEGNMLCGDRDLQGAFVGRMQTSAGPGIVVGAMDGKISGKYGIPLVDIWLFELCADPLEEVLDRLKQAAELQATTETRNVVISLVATLCLIGQNPELVSPVLLSKDDKPGLTQEDIDRLASKARKRGRYGFDIGKAIEVMPHFRRPHPALVWTGEGRKIPKIIMRSGAVVHRNKITDIPTGYLNEST